jgi:hypothetical protein
LDADLNSTVLSGSGNHRMYWAELAMTDQIVEVRVKAQFLNQDSTGFRSGVMVRFTPEDGTSYYAFQMDGDGHVYMGGNPGISGCAGGATVDPEIWHTMRLEVTGSNPVRFRTYLDGVQQHDCTTTAAPVRLSGSPGLVIDTPNSTRVRYDDFVVYAP